MEVNGVKIKEITYGDWQAQLYDAAHPKPKQVGRVRFNTPTMIPYGNALAKEK